MVLSMTGYGAATSFFGSKEIRLEIKAINSKMGDMRFRIPYRYGALEVKLRRIILDSAHRGKFEVNITTLSDANDDEYEINLPLFRNYYMSLRETLKDLNASEDDLASAILKINNVVKRNDNVISEEEEQVVLECLHKALKTLEDFRRSEGKTLEDDFNLRSQNILDNISHFEPLEAKRSEHMRARLIKSFQGIGKEIELDKNRFEQELVYYFEKLDITEEKVRLKQHCEYFLKTLASPDPVKGKSLAFISQEMGREINTLGSKANDHQIQHVVVRMKEELEKIKEQLANVV